MFGASGGRRGGDAPAPLLDRKGPPFRDLTRSTYRTYCRSQAAELLRLLPEDAVRPFYRKAREWAVAREIHDGKDPMASLLRYCRHVLPLPPFREWLRDAARNADAHVRELERRPRGDPDSGPEPFPAETRTFEAGEAVWTATLGLYRDGDAWRGFIAFGREPDTRTLRTAEIFREESPEEVRSRFRSFEPPALRAFLRSVRP